MSTLLDSRYDPLAWGSHIPALGAALAASTGPVLEIGIGHFSTPLLHAYCVASRRALVSLEYELEWFEQFASQYGNDIHQFKGGSYDDLIAQEAKQHWGVVFVDESPGGERRLKSFLAFKTMSQFIVVHDYHLENEDAIKPHLLDMHCIVFNKYQPPTLLASHTTPLNQNIVPS